MSRRYTLAAAALGCALLLPSVALAGGLEYAGGTGARALARGGAVHAKADNPLVLRFDPAGLAELRGGMLNGSMNLGLHDACYDAYGFYGWGIYYPRGGADLPGPDGKTELSIDLLEPMDGNSYPYHDEPLPEVCMDQALAFIPNGAASIRVSEDLGIGFGLIFPSAMPNGRWGDTNGLIRNSDGDLRPSPARHMMTGNGTTGIFPTIGAGYRLLDWLLVGANFQWGLIWADVQRNTPTSPGNNPADDLPTRVIGQDLFVPSVTASVHAIPTDSIDVVAMFRWQDDVLMQNPSAFVTSGVFNDDQQVLPNQELQFDSIFQPMPWAATVAFRYADRLLARPTGTGWGEAESGEIRDPMHDERWDVELDVQYQFNARVDQTSAYPKDTCQPGVQGSCQFITLQGVGGAEPSLIKFPQDLQKDGIFYPRGWKDQVSLRLGGSYNIVPGRFSVHAGAHWENRGINPAYMTPDVWPLERVGLHGGLTYRWRSLDFTLAYGKIWQKTLTVGSPPNGIEEFNSETGVRQLDKRVGYSATRGDPRPVREDPSEPDKVDGIANWKQVTATIDPNAPAFVVNQGKYSSSLDLLAVEITAHF